MSEQEPKDRWQRKVALATNAGGAVAGPAALWMAIRQAKAKEGGMPTQAATAIAEKRPKSPTWGKNGRVLRVLRNPKAVAAGGVTAVGLQAANWAGDATATYELERQKRMQQKKEPTSKSLPSALRGKTVGDAYTMPRYARRRVLAHGDGRDASQSFSRARRKVASGDYKGARFWAEDAQARINSGRNMKYPMFESLMKSFEEPTDYSYELTRGTGHGESLVSKRTFDAEADRQRRLGTYAGLGLGGGVVMGDLARRRITVQRRGEKDELLTRAQVREGREKARAAALKGTKGAVDPKTGKAIMPKVTRSIGHVGSGKTLAALAGGAALSTAGGIAAYRRGISERNQPWR